MVLTLEQLMGLLVYMQIKHLVADYFLQGHYMLGKFNADWSFFKPLAAHCLVHALFTFTLCFLVSMTAAGFNFWLLLLLPALDFTAHFFMDRIKAGPRYLGRFNDKSKPSYWYCLGFDQMFHHLTDLLVVYLLVSSHT